jgi:hypothetical protein
MRGTLTAILRVRLRALCVPNQLRQVLGIVTAFAAITWMRPPSATAQAIGTLQVEARVTAADAEWGSLWAAQQLAGQPSAATSPATPSRVALPLSEIQWVAPGSWEVGQGQPALISVQYLRN